MRLDELPFLLVPSHPDIWARDDRTGALSVTALPESDFYVNPAGADSPDAASMANATTLLGAPPVGDFQFRARVAVEFDAQFDAGVLFVWVDHAQWAKLCLEFSPASEPMVVSVVTRGVSDDANAFTVSQRSVLLRISRLGTVYAFHASTDAQTWQLIRVFALGADVATHRIGFEAQSPNGAGCQVTFDDIGFDAARLGDLRDGS